MTNTTDDERSRQGGDAGAGAGAPTIDTEAPTDPFEDHVAPTAAEVETPQEGADSEADILRSELKRVREKSEALEEELAASNDRFLRARAEMDTMRRRLIGEVEQARDAGLDEALMPVLAVYDDLERALTVAAESDDPASIVTGVQLVKENLERQLAGLGIHRVGLVGEHFDPHLHEALTTVPPSPGKEPGTIAQVFEPGFVKGERLVRVARVIVVAGQEGD
ncbi:MAG: nucleotide exchange factor GrpE [Trueperaceae bacterium]|jgi:molecular chaperone GrpE|nr:nucleotide exchange factor GrpE [Truepera sp.]HRN17725.1 nucleotide exchange factor GrpE [Trueperaceae bacterium]HRQ09401.1 nucleotide exchange factor GrpE [Trueperaceae bacterium]